MPVVLGIDQSLRHTGLFWLDGTEPHWRQVDTTDGMRGAERLVYIKNTILEVVDETMPVLAAMEGYSYGSAGKVFELGELGGVIKVALQERGVPLVVASPVQVKKFVTGNHRAEKEDIVAAVNVVFSLSWNLFHNNVADAAGLALIAQAYLAPDGITQRHKAEVIAALRGDVTLKKKPKKRPLRKFHNI